MSTGKKTLGLGLIGSGFMGKTHVYGFATAVRVFDLPFDIQFHSVADATPALAERARADFGFDHATGDWKQLLDDPAIDIIDITAPNALHREMALAAIAAGKHVYCEKPLAPSAAEAEEMTLAADAAGVCTQVGFNYLQNPMLKLAKQMIAGGELGDLYSYRGIHAEDYMADRQSPWTWRHDPAGGGALADLGSHALATAEYLVGPISEVLGDQCTVIKSRPDTHGTRKPVSVDDVSRVLLRFESGVSGSIEANWIATGRKMQHDFEVSGAKGALVFSQERLNELHYYNGADKAAHRGFRTLHAGPDHPPYDLFCVAPGHQLGFNDLKAIEIEGFVNAIAGNERERATFNTGWRIQRLVETIQASAASGARMGLNT